MKSLNFVALEPTLAWTLVLRRTLILRELVAVSRVDKMFVMKVFCKIVLQIGRGGCTQARVCFARFSEIQLQQLFTGKSQLF